MATPSGSLALPSLHPQPPLVGRDRELAILHAHLTAALAGRGSLVLIGGEAGIGKTALAEALCREAAGQGALVLVGRCYDLSETPPYGLWAEALGRAPHGDDLPIPPDLAAGGGATSQAVLFAAARDYLAALASRQPCVILLDDLHWADPATLDLLRTLARGLVDLPVLLVAAYRANELTRRHPLYALLPLLVREARAARLDLRPLDDDALRALLASYRLPPADIDRLAAHLRAQAEGNPFYAGELLRALEEAEILRVTGGAWALGDLARAGVPPLLRQVIDARVDRLGEDTRELLAAAAVVGQEVPFGLWQAVSGSDEEALLAAVQGAVEAWLLTIAEHGGGVRFVHALIREALYAGIPPLRRRVWHRQVAEVLAAQSIADPDAVAYHFRQAGDPRAYEWLVRAGDRAQRAAAWRTAAERLEAALALLEGQEGNAGERGWLHGRLARLRRHDDFRVALGHAERAVRLAAEVGDAVLAVLALEERGQLRPRVNDQRGGIADLAASVAAREVLAPDDRARLAAWEVATYGRARDWHQARGTLAAWLVGAGRFAEVVDLLEPGLSRTSAQREGGAGTLGFPLGHAYAFLGRPDEARQRFTEARAAVEVSGISPFLIGQIALYELFTVQVPYFADQPSERARVAREGERGWRLSSGQLGLDATPELAHLPVLIADGRWAEARDIALTTRAGGGVNAPVAVGLLGPLAHARGERDLAQALVREALPAGTVTEPGDARYATAMALQRVAAALALDAGDLLTARAWLEAHDRWLDWAGAILGRADGQFGWATYHLAAGNPTEAQRRAESALAHATTPRQPLALLAAHRLLGQLDTAQAHQAAAHDHLARAFALAEACAVPYERALCLLTLAELRLAEGDREATAALLADARAIFADLGAVPALARADALAARLAADASPTAVPALPFGLTAREAEVLRLVAQGLTDIQIAERLFVSRFTVNGHTRAIYGKLGVTTRTAATRLALDHGLR